MSTERGKQISGFIADRYERKQEVKREAQGSMFDTKLAPTQIETGGFPACKHCRGITKAFHKRENDGRRTSRGIIFKWHEWEPKA